MTGQDRGWKLLKKKKGGGGWALDQQGDQTPSGDVEGSGKKSALKSDQRWRAEFFLTPQLFASLQLDSALTSTETNGTSEKGSEMWLKFGQ